MGVHRTVRNRVLEALEASNTILSADQLADIVYADDPDGGPLTAVSVMRVMITNLRKEGHPIISIKGAGNGYFYRRPGAKLPKTSRQILVERTLELYESGMRVCEIARQLDRTPATIVNYLRPHRGTLASRQVRVPAEAVLDVIKTSDRPIRASEVIHMIYGRRTADGRRLPEPFAIHSAVSKLRKGGHRIAVDTPHRGGYVYLGEAA